MKDFEISFQDSEKEPVLLKEGDPLAEKLNVQNSPILFGCRIGICGTCLVEVLEASDEDMALTETETEFLEAMAPHRKTCRLACQIRIRSNMRVRKTEL